MISKERAIYGTTIVICVTFGCNICSVLLFEQARNFYVNFQRYAFTERTLKNVSEFRSCFRSSCFQDMNSIFNLLPVCTLLMVAQKKNLRKIEISRKKRVCGSFILHFCNNFCQASIACSNMSKYTSTKSCHSAHFVSRIDCNLWSRFHSNHRF
jgi:hypothetical protein